MATFASKYSNLKLVIEPTMAKVENGRQYIQYGKSLTFVNGGYHTTDKDKITFLRNHTGKGRLFYELDENENFEEMAINVKKRKVATSK